MPVASILWRRRRALLVELAGHEARRGLDDVNRQPLVSQHLGGLEPEEAAAQHDGAPEDVARARIAWRSATVRKTNTSGKSMPGIAGIKGRSR